MNKSKYLFLLLSSCLPVSCSMALLCWMQIVQRWCYLSAGTVSLRSASRANAFPGKQGQNSRVCSDISKTESGQVGLSQWNAPVPPKWECFCIIFSHKCFSLFLSVLLVSSGWTHSAHRRSLVILVHPQLNELFHHSTAPWEFADKPAFFLYNTSSISSHTVQPTHCRNNLTQGDRRRGSFDLNLTANYHAL